LIPAIDAEHHIDPARRTLMGYSLGGLFTLHALFHRPGLFASYVAASPSIWFADKAELAALPAFEQCMRRGDLHARLLLSAGQYEQSPPPGREKDPAWLKIAALSTRAAMVDNARALSARLTRLPGLSVSFAVMQGETHASGDFPAIRESLLRAFGR
jgi:predicted alpha/beta superfamily hydrolase